MSKTSSLLYAAESWEKTYKAFEEINFTAYDYDAVKQSLIDYLKLQYPENFNDYIESSQMLAIIELFAYISEILAYRTDMSVHENIWGEAGRKQSILKMAKLISYSASRNIPLRGLVKVNSISVSENFTDSQGNNLTNRVIKWDDQNNLLWREQFFTAINKVLTTEYGIPFKSFQVDDTVFQQYEFRNILETESEKSSFTNGVIKTKVDVNGSSLEFEVVPADVDEDGVFERSPNTNSYFTLLYGDDGYGNGSDTTGFMLYLKQGNLQKLVKTFDMNLPNRTVNVNLANVNEVDVWVQKVDETGIVVEEWEQVPNVSGINLAFNTINTQNKYEIETLEDDKIKLIFGDGDFATIPNGIFNIWVRQSNSGEATVAKSQISEKTMTFAYTSKTGKKESCTITYSLVSALQNSSSSETIEHIRAVAPSVYYTQDRMVNGEDYNSYLLKDPSILRLRAVNRTFAGQPKYLNWNDASGSYQNVKIFGNDLRIYYDISANSEITTVSARSLIDDVLEPALSDPGIYNAVIYSFYKTPIIATINGSQKEIRPFVKPRVKFIEDSTQVIDSETIQEKTVIQGALDRHWYGEPTTIVQDSGFAAIAAVVNDDTDYLIYDSKMKCVLKDPETGSYSLIDTPNGVSGIQEAINRQKRFGIAFSPSREFASSLTINSYGTSLDSVPNISSISSSDVNQAGIEEIYTVEITDEDGTFSVYGSSSGIHSEGKVGEAYTNGLVSFLIAFPGNNTSGKIIVGDTFVISLDKINGVLYPSLFKTNLTGRFVIVNEDELPSDASSQSFDPSSLLTSWIMIVERTDGSDGSVAYWTITKRDFSLVVESPTTKFWYNQSLRITDGDTKKPVVDMIRILKSNLDASRTRVLGVDQIYNVVSDVKHDDGETNINALSITPSTVFETIDSSTTGTYQDPLEFLTFVGTDDYVYFKKDSSTGRLTPIESSAFLESLSYTNDTSGNYVRKIGREGLDFMWQHFTPSDHLIDPSTSNIIDIYLLTRGYYSNVQSYVRDLTSVEPVPESSLELRNAYRSLLENKMISDTVILHSARVKFLFGSKAIPELRSKFKIVMASGAKLTSDQVRSRVLSIINDYFRIENWDFGQEFYATELCTVIHKNLPVDIASVVMVPEFPANYFGDLYYIRSAPEEIFVSCATLDNIEIVSSLDKTVLKQKS
jgi:hypothetical protein